MAKYYPKSQIITNLYAQDGESARVNGTLVKAKNSEIYTGFFWTTSNGDYYSGKTPNDAPTEKLIILEDAPEDERAVSPLNPISQTKSKIALLLDDPEIEIAGFQGVSPSGNPNWQWSQANIIYYMNAKSISTQTPPEYDNPYTNPNLPTEKDYEVGSFRRYFAKKRNSNVYIEIDNSMYSNLISFSNKITYFEYKPFRLPWTITGDKQQVKQVNRNIVSLTARKRNLPGFVEYINNDYLKYHSFYTKGKEYKLPNGEPYIGLYHIHPDKGAMVGKTHTSTPHSKLTPIDQPSQFTSSSLSQPQQPPQPSLTLRRNNNYSSGY